VCFEPLYIALHADVPRFEHLAGCISLFRSPFLLPQSFLCHRHVPPCVPFSCVHEGTVLPPLSLLFYPFSMCFLMDETPCSRRFWPASIDLRFRAPLIEFSCLLAVRRRPLRLHVMLVRLIVSFLICFRPVLPGTSTPPAPFSLPLFLHHPQNVFFSVHRKCLATDVSFAVFLPSSGLAEFLPSFFQGNSLPLQPVCFFSKELNGLLPGFPLALLCLLFSRPPLLFNLVHGFFSLA